MLYVLLIAFIIASIPIALGVLLVAYVAIFESKVPTIPVKPVTSVVEEKVLATDMDEAMLGRYEGSIA